MAVQGKNGKGHSKRKAPDELWTDGIIPERQNPLVNFLADKLPKEFIQVGCLRLTRNHGGFEQDIVEVSSVPRSLNLIF
jgi:hypothetical protein